MTCLQTQVCISIFKERKVGFVLSIASAYKKTISANLHRERREVTKIFDVSRQVPFHRSHKLTTSLLKISRTTLSVFQEVHIKLNSFETIVK